MILVGIDAGATRTRALAVDAEGQLVGRGSGGPANPYVVGAARAAGEIAAAAIRAASGRTGEDMVVVAGVAGISDVALREELQGALLAHGPNGQWHLFPETIITLEGALRGRPGIVVIAGTGSVAIGRNEAGEEAQAGGWGYLVEDTGSGTEVGRGVFSVVLRAHDGRGPQTALSALLLRTLGVRGPDEISRAIRAMTVTELSDLARLAVAAAGEGDEVAGRLLTRAAGALADMARAVWDRLHFTTPHPVAWSGGLLRQTAVRAAFSAAVARLCPQAEVGPPDMSATGGALLRAFALARLPFPDDLMQRLATEGEES